jgi:hypothetical protein
MKLIFKRIRFFKTKNPNKQANRRRFPAEGIASVWNSTRRMEKEAEEADGEREKKKAKGFGLRAFGGGGKEDFLVGGSLPPATGEAKETQSDRDAIPI